MKIYMKILFIMALIVAALWAWMPQAMAQAQPVTDAVVLNDLGELIGMFGLGVPGYGLALGLLALMMKLTKWGRVKSLFQRVPARYRSLIPIGLGSVIGAVEGLSTGLPLLPALLKGALAVGGGQQLLYEQSKGTGLAKIIEAATAFIPQPPALKQE